MDLYRYRSVKSAIKDIKSGAFYFASRNELNDPVEGHVSVYWKGDKPAWEGLFNNYVCSLFYAISNYLLAEDESVLWEKTLLTDIHAFDSVPLGGLLRKVGADLLYDEVINRIVSFYGKKELKCSSEELHLILQLIHNRAFCICMGYYKDSGIVSKEEADKILKRQNLDVLNVFPLEQLKKSESDNIRSMIAAIVDNGVTDLMEHQVVKLGLQKPGFAYGKIDFSRKNLTKVKRERQHRNWIALYMEFPRMYISQMKNMVYPDAYFVCFSGKNDNSVMWGNYADNHKGVCLIYDVDYNSSERDERAGYYIEGAKINPRKVEYGGEIIERNFFETFGRLTRPQIKAWLTGKDGSLSKYFEPFKDDNSINEWRTQYWETFRVKNFRKLEAWSYEEEYRVFVENCFYKNEDVDKEISTKTEKQKRNLKYDIKMLKGIIFGIRTSEYDKIKIIKALTKKGIADDIEYYQADYDDRSQKIVIRRKLMWGKSSCPCEES